MTTTSSEFAAIVQQLADATGTQVLVGCYPSGGGWFAHCNCRKSEGDTPIGAVRALLASMQAMVIERARNLEESIEVEKRMLKMLDAAAVVNGQADQMRATVRASTPGPALAEMFDQVAEALR